MSSRKLLLFLCAVMFFSGLRSAKAQLGLYGTFTGQKFGGVTCPAFAAPCAKDNGEVTPYGGNFGVFYDFRNFGPVRLGADLRGEVLSSNKRGDSSAGGSNTFRQYVAMGGVRATVRTRLPWLKPYAEVAAGMARNNASGLYTKTTTTTTATETSATPTGTTTTTSTGTVTLNSFDPSVYKVYPAFKGFVGVDIKILPFLDLRAIELGLGSAFGSTVTGVATTVLTNETVTQTATGTTTTINSSSSSSVNTSSSPTGHLLQSIGAGVVFHLP